MFTKRVLFTTLIAGILSLAIGSVPGSAGQGRRKNRLPNWTCPQAGWVGKSSCR